VTLERPPAIPTGFTVSEASLSEHSLKRIALALELILNQSEQQTALMASLSESARILCDAVERAADNDEEG
jgi:hypothetical protein